MQHYRVTRRLARGGMTEVFLGQSVGTEGFEKTVALKRVLPALAKDPAVTQMFVADAQLARHLHHQNIVSVTDVGRGPDGVFLVMELVNGWDLHRLLECACASQTVFPPHLAAWVVRQLNEALTHAYGRRVNGRPVIPAHGDLCDSNILLSRDGEVKLADFHAAAAGASATGEDQSKRVTDPSRFKGRRRYAAPELFMAGAPPSPSSDQFALGVVFVQLLTGQLPWGSPAADPAAYLPRVASAPPDLAAVPAALRPIVSQMLAKDPSSRWATPADLTRALGGFLANVGAAAGAFELSQFLQTLNPPPAPLDGPMGPTEETTGSFSLAALAEEATSPEWEPPPGLALDASGALHGIHPGTGHPSDDAPAPGGGGPAEAREPLKSPTASPGIPSRRTPPRPTAPSPMGGSVERTASGDLLPPAGLSDDAPLELARDLRRQEAEPTSAGQWQVGAPADAPAARRSSSGVPVLGVLAFIALVVGALYLWGPLRRTFIDALPNDATPLLLIESEPSGASILVDGREIGTTPFSGDNLYPDREIPFELRMKGYQSWKGTFRGAQDDRVDVDLIRRVPRKRR